jgi:rod shape-determining protein MreC
MRNLFDFIAKNYFVILFLLLETISFIIIVRYNRYQRYSVINSSSAFVGDIYTTFNNITEYLYLKKANEDLAKQNARLKELSQTAFLSNYLGEIVINDTMYIAQYQYLSAKAVNNSVNKSNNYITIDRGTKNGVHEGMGVISPEGAVGVVIKSSEHYSVVLPLLNSRSKISGKVQGKNYFGQVEWQGVDPKIAYLKDVPKHAKLEIGDKIVTSGASIYFPEGIEIGTIKSFELNESDGFYQIEVELAVDYASLSYVFVIKNTLGEEQLSLENLIEIE